MFVFTEALIEALANMVRSMTFGGQPVFSKVYTEKDGRFVRFDIEGVMGELFFEVAPRDDEKPDTPCGVEQFSISHEQLDAASVGLVDAIAHDEDGVRVITDAHLVSVSLIPAEQTLHPSWRVIEIDGKQVE